MAAKNPKAMSSAELVIEAAQAIGAVRDALPGLQADRLAALLVEVTARMMATAPPAPPLATFSAAAPSRPNRNRH